MCPSALPGIINALLLSEAIAIVLVHTGQYANLALRIRLCNLLVVFLAMVPLVQSECFPAVWLVMYQIMVLSDEREQVHLPEHAINWMMIIQWSVVKVWTWNWQAPREAHIWMYMVIVDELLKLIHPLVKIPLRLMLIFTFSTMEKGELWWPMVFHLFALLTYDGIPTKKKRFRPQKARII
jgi:hypothetical protein